MISIIGQVSALLAITSLFIAIYHVNVERNIRKGLKWTAVAIVLMVIMCSTIFFI